MQWEKELELQAQQTRKRRTIRNLVAGGIIGVVGLGVVINHISDVTKENGVPQIANSATFTYDFGVNSATAVVPTPKSMNGMHFMTLFFSCAPDGTFKMENTSLGYKKEIGEEGFSSMRLSNIVTENPCNEGLTVEDTQALGEIIKWNGFATYNIPVQVAQEND